MNRRQHLMQRLWRKHDKLTDWLLDHDLKDKAPDWIYDSDVLQPLCNLLGAHYVVDDHCMKPEHRSCLWCLRRMPGAEPALFEKADFT